MVTKKANLSFKNKLPHVSITDEASDFKFGMHMGFAKARHQIPRKSQGGPGLWELSKILGFPFHI